MDPSTLIDSTVQLSDYILEIILFIALPILAWILLVE
jgi:hypothetical protein